METLFKVQIVKAAKLLTLGELSLSMDCKFQFSPFLWSQKAIICLPVAFMVVLVGLKGQQVLVKVL